MGKLIQKTKPILVKGLEKIAMKKKNNTNFEVSIISNILIFFKIINFKQTYPLLFQKMICQIFLD